MFLTFILLGVFEPTNAAPMLFPSTLDLSAAYDWPLWSGGPYLYHPSIRWMHRPPIFYVWPAVMSPTSTSPVITATVTDDQAQNRLFPTYTKQDSDKNRDVLFESSTLPSQSIAAEHRGLPETDDDMQLDDLEPASNESVSVNVTVLDREKRQVIFPGSEGQSKGLSQGGKLVFDGLSMLGTALAATAYSRPGSSPLLHHIHPPPFPPPPPPHPPLFHPFLFPGPSALYPQLFPLGVNSQNYYPAVPSPYQALSIDSLLVPLVGMVGLSLLVPDIVKTKREGRPSDLDGLDVFRQLSQDEECLKRLACEAGVVIDPNDDPAAIKRALERGWTARSRVPSHHYGNQHQSRNCGSHNCELNLGSSDSKYNHDPKLESFSSNYTPTTASVTSSS